MTLHFRSQPAKANTKGNPRWTDNATGARRTVSLATLDRNRARIAAIAAAARAGEVAVIYLDRDGNVIEEAG